MMTDIEIAQSTPLCPIAEIAAKAGIPATAAEPYGSNKAKITEDFLRQREGKPQGKLILVTAVNPTPAGEGKTTTSIGLAQALCRLGKNAIVTLREPSLGPVFGLKGGAAGGGYSQVLPMEEINLHFTGDIHAVTAANNLLSALIDNHIHQGNALRLDPERIVFRRCMDMNDRSLRKIEIGLGGKANGTPRFDGFQISVASEVMAILCLAKDLKDLRERLGRILVGYTVEGKPVFAHDLQAEGAMAALLREALRPNLVQTLEHTPCLMHGGPFANIAHGCNSVRATRLALTLADYTVTEAGFGSDLGAEKFFDIKCPAAGITPAIAVLVVTVRALRYNGGCDKESCRTPNAPAVAAGLCNLTAHVENLRQYGVPVVVAINRFPDDLPEELALIQAECDRLGVRAAQSEVFAKGGAGGLELAEAVLPAGSRVTLLPLPPPPCPCGRKSKPSPKRFTAPPPWNTAPKRKSSWRRWPPSVWNTPPSASPKPSTPSAITPSCWAVRRATPCISVALPPAAARASRLRWPAASSPCRACPPIPPPWISP